MSRVPRVWTGLDALVSERFRRLRGRKVGAIANPTSVDSRMRHLADLLGSAEGVDLRCLFGPEHGVRADAQDMVGVESALDSRTGVPVHSLYGDSAESLRPDPEILKDLDVLIYDVQDVGSRYYTFAATLLYSMEAASGLGVEILVLDRPNPIGGLRVEGPSVEPGYHSFVGAHDVPIRHGLTVGEFARLFASEKALDVDLQVIPCEGWDRSMLFGDTALPWVLPSPNMPSPDTALVYPGGCLLEGTNLSEGRGTTRPFELWGAPWLDPDALFAGLPETGCYYRPCAFRPTFHKHAGNLCLGVQPVVTDPAQFFPTALYTEWTARARSQDPGRFHWRTKPYEFVSDPIAIDLLFGSSQERVAIEQGVNTDGLVESWLAAEDAFLERRAPFLLYASEHPASTSRGWLSQRANTRVLFSQTRPSGQVAPMSQTPSLVIDGLVETPLQLTYDDLLAFPEADQVLDVSRFSPARKGDGVALEALLARARPRPDADYLTLHADRDDFHVSIPLEATRSEGIVVYRLGGQPLSPDQGGPVRFLIRDPSACRTSELDDCANVKYLSRIELSHRKGRDTRPHTDEEHEALHQTP